MTTRARAGATERATVIVREPLLLEATLRGGQAFRWRARADGRIVGVAGARHVSFKEVEGAIEATVTPAEGAHAWLADYFRLDARYERTLARLSRDPVLAPAVARWRGLRLLRQDPWEALASFIVSANNNVLRIEGIMERLSRAAGERIAPRLPRAFPTPEAVGALTEARLRSLGLGYRAPFLRKTARAVAGSDLHALRKSSLTVARDALIELPGVGPKVADCVCLFALDQDAAFPVDRWVLRAYAQAYMPRRRQAPTERAVREDAARRFGNDAGLAQQFLFHDARAQSKRA